MVFRKHLNQVSRILGDILCVYKDFNWFLAYLVSIYMQNIIKPLGTHSLAQTQTHQHKDKNTLKHIKRMIMMMMVMLMSFKLLRGIKIRKTFRRVTISWCRTQGTRQVRFDRIKCDCFWLFLFFLSQQRRDVWWGWWKIYAVWFSIFSIAYHPGLASTSPRPPNKACRNVSLPSY